MTDDATLKRILETHSTIAIVGLSDKTHRASYVVGKYLLDHGYTIIPVNPTITEVLGQKSYASLESIPVPVHIVNCFRRSEEMEALAKAAVQINAKVMWMQLDIINDKARALAESHGLEVVMDRCTKIEHARLLGRRN